MEKEEANAKLAQLLKKHEVLIRVIGAHTAALVAAHPDRTGIQAAAEELLIGVRRKWYRENKSERTALANEGHDEFSAAIDAAAAALGKQRRSDPD